MQHPMKELGKPLARVSRHVIERESVIRLSWKDARKVLALLDNPPKPSKRLLNAVNAFKDTVRA